MKSLNLKKGKWFLAVGVLLSTTIASYGGSGGLSIGRDTTICAGNCLTLKSNLTGTYFWSTGATSSSITVCPSGNQTIILWLTNGSTVLTDTIHIKVDKNPVYPGDADNNGSVNKTDVLKIGLAYGYTGQARSQTGNSWSAVHAENWNKAFKGGTNYKYADCNGDGIIDKNDLAAIYANYSHTHNKTEETNVDGNPDLYYIPNKDSVGPGDTLILHIMLGTNTNPVNNIYGIAFTHNFDPGTVQENSMTLDVNPSNCWFYDNGGDVMTFFRPDYVTESADIAISKTDGSAVSGYGQIGDLNVFIPDNVNGKRNHTDQMVLNTSEITAISNDESSIQVNKKSTKVYWKSITTGITPIIYGAQVEVYPNPVSDKTLTIHFSGLRAEKLEITDMLGNSVYSEEKSLSVQTIINLPDKLKQGFYLVRVSSDKGMIVKKVLIN